MIHFEESQLAFAFGDRWNVLKLDEHPVYRQGIEKIQDTKAVDFVGVFNGERLYLIEVKNFRGYRIESKQRLHGELPVEIARKVKDSLACLIGAFHQASDSAAWKPYAQTLCKRTHPIHVVVWLEEGVPPPDFTQRQKLRASIGTKIFKQKLAWLTSHVLVCSSKTRDLPDVSITNVPHA